MNPIVPFCRFWRFSLDRIKGFILGESRLAKGWREGVMVRVAMMRWVGLFWRDGAKRGDWRSTLVDQFDQRNKR